MKRDALRPGQHWKGRHWSSLNFFLTKKANEMHKLSNLFDKLLHMFRSLYSDWLLNGRFGHRIPVRARFSEPIQTGPGAHLASCTMRTGFFPGVKSGRGVTLTPHPFYCRGQERVELYLYSLYGPYALYRASVPVQGCTYTTCFGQAHCIHTMGNCHARSVGVS